MFYNSPITSIHLKSNENMQHKGFYIFVLIKPKLSVLLKPKLSVGNREMQSSQSHSIIVHMCLILYVRLQKQGEILNYQNVRENNVQLVKRQWLRMGKSVLSFQLVRTQGIKNSQSIIMCELFCSHNITAIHISP